VRWNFSPVLDLGRQPLWSRNFETLGEDPYLASLMGAAIVEGYQGEVIGQYHVAACMKHFVGYSASFSGRDRTPAWIPEKYMKELYLPSFKKAVDAGALTVMINSGVVNGVPGHVNYQLLTETLKNEWGFKGFAVSDWEDFIMLHTVHRTSGSLADAYVAAFNAGVDMSMVPLSPQYKEYCDIMVNAVKSGKISMERLDDAVRRILRVKVITGLYDDPSFKPELYSDFGSEKFKTAALNSALESITLLKNENNVLPLKTGGKILIAGPTADNLVFLNGAWTHTWQGVDSNYNTQNCKTVRQAIEGKFGKENCLYTKGAELVIEDNFEKTNFVDLDDYAKKLDQADVVVLCLGEMPSTEKPGDIHSLNLDPEQRELAKMAYKKNKKVVLVLLEGRPRIIHDIVEGAAAIVQCYLPGDYGAEALVKLLSGEVNFSGKLPYTYPKFDGVIEFYDHPRSVDRSKAGDFSAYNPEWDFGFGLSYSKVEYSALKMNNTSFTTEEKITISVNVKNTSNRSVKEVVQVYIGDLYAELVPEGKKLKRFSKVEIPANAEMTVDFEISAKDLMFVNQQGIFVHGDGEFNVFVGGLETHFTLNK
jgi:beta-glucosidase